MSTHPYMGWGLFALQVAKAGDELLPFFGKRYSKIEFNSMCNENPRFKNYVLRLKRHVYQDSNVLKQNVAGFINSCIGREELQMSSGSMCPCLHLGILRIGDM